MGPPPNSPTLWLAAAEIRRLARRSDIYRPARACPADADTCGRSLCSRPLKADDQTGRSVSASVDEQEVNDVDRGEAPIAGVSFDELSDLRSQLSREVNERPGTAGLDDPGDDLSDSCLAGLGTMIV